MELSGKTVIVTGGGTGQGRAISLRLAEERANLAIVYSRSEAEANHTASECAAKGGRAIALRADVARDADVRAMVARVREELGRIDVLVNNAGTTVFQPMSELDGYSEGDWDRIMAVNTKAHWLTARAVVPHMREQAGGAIVSVTSIAGLNPRGSSMPYCVSKAGAIMLTKCLAMGLSPEIRVNNVATGLLRTGWWGGFAPDLIRHYEEAAPLKRASAIEDVADAVAMVIKNDSMTGQTIVVDCGLYPY